MQHVGDRVFPIQLYVNAYRNPSEHTARHVHWCRQLTLTIGSSSSRRELEVDGEGVPGGSGRVVFRCVEGSVVLLDGQVPMFLSNLNPRSVWVPTLVHSSYSNFTVVLRNILGPIRFCPTR